MRRFNYFISIAGVTIAYHYGVYAVCYAYGFFWGRILGLHMTQHHIDNAGTAITIIALCIWATALAAIFRARAKDAGKSMAWIIGGFFPFACFVLGCFPSKDDDLAASEEVEIVQL